MQNIVEILVFCQFCEKVIIVDKVRDQCHLTGEYRRSAHDKSNNIVPQKQINFITFAFYIFSGYGCHFLKRLFDKKMI